MANAMKPSAVCVMTLAFMFGRGLLCLLYGSIEADVMKNALIYLVI